MRILVTGGTGSIGRTLVRSLLGQGHRVRILSRRAAAECRDRISGIDGAEWFQGDLRAPDRLVEAVNGVDAICHLACDSTPADSNRSPLADAGTNLMGSIALLDAAVGHGVRKFCFVSSGGSIYGDTEARAIDEDHPAQPISAYGIVKMAVERYLQLYGRIHGLGHTILRISNAYGFEGLRREGFGAVDTFAARILRDETIEIWGDGSTVRDYVHADDVVRALTQAVNHPEIQGIFNIGSGRGTRLIDLIRIIEATVDRKARVIHKPARPADPRRNVLDISKARTVLGWAPGVTLEQGVRLLCGRLAETDGRIPRTGS